MHDIESILRGEGLNEEVGGSYGNITHALYHGSPLDLKEITPMYSKLVGKKVIYAGPKWLAVSFTARWRDTDILQGTVNNIPYMTEMYKGAFDVFDKGGWIYLINDKTKFKYVEELTKFEVISTVPVHYVSKEFIPSPLELLEELGVVLNKYKKERS